MVQTEKRISDVFAAFQTDEDPGLLYLALDEVEDALRNAEQGDRAACKRALSLLLSFLAALDQKIDPKWDSSKAPVRGVPPPVPGLPVYGSGEVDPSAINDPVIRARYEQDLKTNSDKVKHFSVQFQLRRIEERATDDLKRFVERCFTSASADRREFEELLATSSLSSVRKNSFRKLLRWRLW